MASWLRPLHPRRPAAPILPPRGRSPPRSHATPLTPDGLLARLDDLFGVTTSGQGIDFDDTTEVGQLNRAWVFTEAWLAGGASDDPVELVNLWTAPITIADKPVGLATIWINTTTDAPDLADFDRSASSAQALLDVPAETQLVRDEPRAAWFTLVEGKLTPLIAGDSGVDAATPLTAYQRLITGTDPPAASVPARDGLLGAGIVAGAAVLVVLVVLLLPILRRHAGDKDPDEGLSVSTAAITLPTKAELRRAEAKKAERQAKTKPADPAAVPASTVSAFAPALEPEPVPTVRPPAKTSAAAKPATPRKLAAAKPTTPRSSAGSSAKAGTPKTGAAKSATGKATAAKSTTAKPSTAKSTTAKSTTPRPTTSKPATPKSGAARKPTSPLEENPTP